MNVLVVGGTRFVGYLLVWRLLARGDRVTVLNRGTLPDPFGDRVERLQADRRTADFAARLEGRRFDAVVDFVAYEASDIASVLATLGDRVGHYVFVSTGQVYLMRRDLEARTNGTREEDYDGPLIAEPDPAHDAEHGQWEYGMGKRACEGALIDAWRSRGFPFTSLRIPMVNGERDHHRRVDAYLVRLLDGEPVLVPDGGTRPMRHVYGADVAATIAALLGDRRTFGEAFNLGHRETPTLRHVLTKLRALVGSKSELVDVPVSTLEANGIDVMQMSPFSTGRWMSFMDPSRALTALPFDPTPYEETLGRIAASHVAHPPADFSVKTREKELEIARAI